MKKKLASTLAITVFIITAASLAAAHSKTSDDINAKPKTVAIENATSELNSESTSPAESTYDQIMQNQHQMDKRMSRFFNDPYFSSRHFSAPFTGSGRGYPKSHFYTKDNGYILQFVIPGMDKENVSIELQNRNVLMISAKNAKATKSKGNNNQSYQNIASAFSQSFTIPPDVDATKITADYKNGVLTINFPKDLTKANAKAIKIPIN